MKKLKQLAALAIGKLLAKFPINRVAVLLTPTVFMPVSGWLCAWAATHLPGLPRLDPLVVSGIFAAGATAALVKAYAWLKGWQAAEERTALQGTRETPQTGTVQVTDGPLTIKPPATSTPPRS